MTPHISKEKPQDVASKLQKAHDFLVKMDPTNTRENLQSAINVISSLNRMERLVVRQEELTSLRTLVKNLSQAVTEKALERWQNVADYGHTLQNIETPPNDMQQIGSELVNESVDAVAAIQELGDIIQEVKPIVDYIVGKSSPAIKR